MDPEEEERRISDYEIWDGEPQEEEIYEVWGTVQFGSEMCASAGVTRSFREPIRSCHAVTNPAPILFPLYSFRASSMDEAEQIWNELQAQEWPVGFEPAVPLMPDNVWSLM